MLCMRCRVWGSPGQDRGKNSRGLAYLGLRSNQCLQGVPNDVQRRAGCSVLNEMVPGTNSYSFLRKRYLSSVGIEGQKWSGRSLKALRAHADRITSWLGAHKGLLHGYIDESLHRGLMPETTYILELAPQMFIRSIPSRPMRHHAPARGDWSVQHCWSKDLWTEYRSQGASFWQFLAPTRL